MLIDDYNPLGLSSSLNFLSIILLNASDVMYAGLCYGKLEAGVLTFIIPALLLGHLVHLHFLSYHKIWRWPIRFWFLFKKILLLDNFKAKFKFEFILFVLMLVLCYLSTWWANTKPHLSNIGLVLAMEVIKEKICINNFVKTSS